MNSRLIMKLNKLMLLLIVTFVLTACGQKGGLYLPDEKQTSLNSPVLST